MATSCVATVLAIVAALLVLLGLEGRLGTDVGLRSLELVRTSSGASSYDLDVPSKKKTDEERGRRGFMASRHREKRLLEAFIKAQEELLGTTASFDLAMFSEGSTKSGALCAERNKRLRELAFAVDNPSILKSMVRALDVFGRVAEYQDICQGAEHQVGGSSDARIDGYLLDGHFFQQDGRRQEPGREQMRRVLVDSSHAKGLGQKLVLVRVVPMQTTGSTANLDASFVSGVTNLVNDFFLENSGGLQSFKVVLHHSVVRVNSFTINNGMCADSNGHVPSSSEIADEAEAQLKSAGVLDDADRIVFSLPYCRSLGYGGLGEAPGKRVWMNGRESSQASFAGILCHELGHNNGALHAEHEELEYGNGFSIMGSGRGGVPNAHFSLGAKVAFGWIDEKVQIATLSKDCSATDGNDGCYASGTFWVHAHDYGTYKQENLYGLRIMIPDDPDEQLWVEFRQKYYSDELVPGAMLVWAYNAGMGMYGPTQLVDFDDITSTQTDATIPVGQSYAYDIEENGASAIISVLAVNGNAIQVFVRFVSDQERTELLGQAEKDLPQIICESPYTVHMNQMPLLLHLPLDHPSDLSLSHECSDQDSKSIGPYTGELDENYQGVYVYPRIPLHFFLNSGFDDLGQLDINLSDRPALSYPGAGATFFAPVDEDCSSASASAQTTLSDTLTASTGFPVSYHEFSSDNYVLVDAKAPVTLKLSCTILHCSANHYYDATSDQCEACPNNMVSLSGSNGISSCYEACKALWVKSNSDSGAIMLYDGIWNFDSVMNGASSFARFGNDIGAFDDGFLYRVYGRWVIGPINGRSSWWTTIIFSDVAHPMAIGPSQQNFEFTCARCDYASRQMLPTCNLCSDLDTVVEPTRPDRCFKACKNLQVTSQYGSLSGIFQYQGVDGLRPYFVCSTGSCAGKQISNLNGKWLSTLR